MTATMARVSAAVVASCMLSACGASSTSPSASRSGSTVWLCRPGVAPDPCAGSLDWSEVDPSGAVTEHPGQPAANPVADCFYVYPTVSTEPGLTADLRIQPAETKVAIEQAARFSSVCRVWAPMYRQRTLNGIASSLSAANGSEGEAYASLLSGWQDYLSHYNDGRPVVFIGHSQGSAVLIHLLQSQVDGNAALRARMISAVLPGGNVTVPDGAQVGSTFDHIPLCSSTTSIGCVVAYSSFADPPPPNSLFGIPGQGVSLQSDQTQTIGVHVACVDPTGGAQALDPYFATVNGTSVAWYEFPDLYQARCMSSGNATWLQVDDIGSASDPRPRVSQTLGPTWGLHTDDVNIALGNLVTLVGRQVSAFEAASS